MRNRVLGILITACFILSSLLCHSQNVGVGTANPDPTALLDIVANNKGLLIPRMLSSQRTGIPSPANGLLIYDLDSASLFIYQQTGWRRIRAISKLNDLIAGNTNGDVLVWNGVQWAVVAKSAFYTYVYRDADGDGHGDKFSPVAGVLPFPGFVADSIDCNDANATIYNGATEICGDGLDNDCNGQVDEIPNGNPDLPDDTFFDANCDGIDGTEASAIFVSTTGNNGNPGTKSQPVLTIATGIARAIAQGKTQLFVSMGTYNEKVTLSNGISLYGGYNAAAAWARSSVNTTTISFGSVISDRVSAMEGFNITTPTTVDRFTIQSGNATGITATGNGRNSYGVYCSGCTALTIKNAVITAGNGSAGQAGGSAGISGADGVDGTNGVNGSCNISTAASGGPGGVGVLCSVSSLGGLGGAGRYGNLSGVSGLNGTLSANGNGVGGPGGPAGINTAGGAGTDGTDGADGLNGSNGSGGSSGVMVTGFWVTNSGGAGSNGVIGGAGGGGGGGGGYWINIIGDVGTGNGGGGGGSGGCNGTSGVGGRGGGASFGMLIVNSTGLVLTNNTITSGNGGNGGNGSNGGAGGTGGIGGTGATNCTISVGKGGDGGDGGDGGSGGGGGGGGGGISYAIGRNNTTLSLIGNTLNPGTGGNGGSGGTSPGNGTGASGSNGNTGTQIAL